MAADRMAVVFRPACGKMVGDISRHMTAIERVIAACGGEGFSEDPHGADAFRFLLPPGSTAWDAASVVLVMDGLRDRDGTALVEADPVVIPAKSLTLADQKPGKTAGTGSRGREAAAPSP